MSIEQAYTIADLANLGPIGTEAPVRLGVLGDPIAHSLSPQMQNAALQHCGLNLQYARFHIPAPELPEAFRRIRESDFIGFNLTIPHKTAAVGLVNAIEGEALKIGAINTVVREAGQLVGLNTDGPGFARAIREEFAVDLRDLRVLVLGAGGGAGRAIAWQCALDGCERLVLVNRTEERVRTLADQLRVHLTGPRVLDPMARLEVVPWENVALTLQLANTDLVINATPLGLKRSDPPPLPASLLMPHLMVYDTTYGSRSPFLSAAREAGARTADGMSMLLHQGALAFERWFDRAAPVDEMRRGLKAAAG